MLSCPIAVTCSCPREHGEPIANFCVDCGTNLSLLKNERLLTLLFWTSFPYFVSFGVVLFAVWVVSERVLPLFVATGEVLFGLAIGVVLAESPEFRHTMKHQSPLPVIATSLMAASMVGFAGIITFFSSTVPQFFAPTNELLLNSPIEPIVTVAVGPVLEELFFRGILLMLLVWYIGKWPGLILSSVLFALIHLSPFSLFIQGILGFACGYAYLRYENLLMPILMHAIYNFSVVHLEFSLL